MEKVYNSRFRPTFLILGVGWIMLAILHLFLLRSVNDYIRLFGNLLLGILCILRAAFSSIVIGDKTIKISAYLFFRKIIGVSDITKVTISKSFLFKRIKLETNKRTYYIYNYYDIPLQELFELVDNNISTD